MPTDIATLGIKIDSQSVKQADNDLAKLAKTGEVAEHSTRGVASATEELADRVARLKSSVDPLGLAQSKVNAEIAEAETLYARGAISAAEFSQAQLVLAARAETFRDQQERSNTLLRSGAASAKLAGHEMLNMGRQFSDVGVQLAMGMNPLMILIQQGPQIADVLAVAGARGVTAGAAFRQMGIAAWTALAPLLPIILAIGAGVAVIGGAFAIFANEAEKSVGSVNKSLGLTKKELASLKEQGVSTSITMGDAFLGLYDTIKDVIVDAFGPQLEWLEQKFGQAYAWLVQATGKAVKFIVGGFVGSVYAIKTAWEVLPGAIGAVVMQTAQLVVNGIVGMVNGAIDAINGLIGFLPDWVTDKTGFIKHVPKASFADGYAGKASKAMGDIAGSFNEGMAVGSNAAGNFADKWAENSGKRRDRRVRKALGDRDTGGGAANDNGGGSKGGAGDDAAKEAENFLKSLRDETAEIGKNRIEVKMMAVEKAAAAAPTAKLAEEIRKAGAAWKTATTNNAIAELKRDLGDTAEAMEYENRLLGMNAKERAVASAQREIDLKLRALERQGIDVTTDAVKAETDAILANAEARGQRELNVDNARAYTDSIREMNDALREGVQGFGQLFGTAGVGFEALINTMTNYADRRAELQQQIAEADERTAEGQRQRQEATAEMARAEVSYYGDMLGAAKRLFKEKSAGYRALEAVEKAYRAYQMVSLILEAIGVTKSIALDGAKTASSVTNSGIRAAADGVAAIAKAIASLPFPLNLVAGAATAAALVAFGVKVFGGKGGGGASATSEAESKQPIYSGARDEYGNPTSGYSVLKPGSTVANDNGSIAPAPGIAAGQNVGSTVNSSPTYHINVEGNADAGTVQQLQAVLEAHEDRVVAKATQAAAQDMATRAGRQRIGGAG